MKIIHTSDWHLGQVFYQYSREDECLSFFGQLAKIVEKEKPDALVVSGDVFHTATPSVTTQRLYYHELVKLSRLDNDLQIVVTGGNHDSPSRIEAPRELWEAFNVSVVGMLDFHSDNDNGLTFNPDKLIVPITRSGSVVGWVLAVPFVNAGNYPSLEENDTYSNRVKEFYSSLMAYLAKKTEYQAVHPVVAMGHFVVGGSDFMGHDHIIGGVESTDGRLLASIEGIDYWALGHVHHPQFIVNQKNMRYSGSVMPVSFDESFEHSVSIVNIENHEVDVTTSPIEPLIPILDFPNKPKSYSEALPFESVLLKISEIPDDKKVYVRLHVQTSEPITQLQNAAFLDAFKDKQAMLCNVYPYFPEKDANCNCHEIKTLHELKAMSPFELGCSVYQKKNNVEMPEEMKKLFKEICDEFVSEN